MHKPVVVRRGTEEDVEPLEGPCLLPQQFEPMPRTISTLKILKFMHVTHHLYEKKYTTLIINNQNDVKL